MATKATESGKTAQRGTTGITGGTHALMDSRPAEIAAATRELLRGLENL